METTDLMFKFSIERVNVILSALAEIPFRMSADIIADIRQQAEGQVQAPAVQTPVVQAQEEEVPANLN